MSHLVKILIPGILVALVVGCGGSSSTTPQGTVINVMFAGPTVPQSIAAQIGSGAFAPVSLQPGNILSVTLPSGTTKYAIAYVCPVLGNETVLEATIQDGTQFTANCPAVRTSNLGLATGSVDASTIAGATNVEISPGGSLNGVSGSFSLNMPVGNDDVAFLAFNSTGTALAVKIERSQSIPGAINGGNMVLFGPSDATTMQPGAISNVPAGFPQPGVAAQYHTANGTTFPLNTVIVFGQPPMYPAVPAAATQSGDFYLYSTVTFNTPTISQQLGIRQTTTNGGGPVTLALPAPWSYSGPTAAALPTFTFNYSGFSGLPAMSQQAALIWSTGPSAHNSITVTATANFQDGATTLAIPDLTALSGFVAPAPSGTQISWFADIYGGTTQEYIFSINPPSNGSVAFVENRGSFIQP